MAPISFSYASTTVCITVLNLSIGRRMGLIDDSLFSILILYIRGVSYALLTRDNGQGMCPFFIQQFTTNAQKMQIPEKSNVIH